MLKRFRQLIGRVPGARLAMRAWRHHSASFRRPVRFWDGQVRKAEGQVARLFAAWRVDGMQARESDVVFKTYRGGDFIDVGAYQGWYAALLAPRARAGDRFLLLEPDPRALPALYQVAADLSRIFPHLNIAVLPIAAGTGKPAQITFPYGQDGHPRILGGEADNGPPTVRLDDLVNLFGLKPALVKIDVEGAEWDVMQGAQTLLDDGDIDLMLELHPQWLPAGVDVEFLRGNLRRRGYGALGIDLSSNVAWRELWSRRAAGACR